MKIALNNGNLGRPDKVTACLPYAQAIVGEINLIRFAELFLPADEAAGVELWLLELHSYGLWRVINSLGVGTPPLPT